MDTVGCKVYLLWQNYENGPLMLVGMFSSREMARQRIFDSHPRQKIEDCGDCYLWVTRQSGDVLSYSIEEEVVNGS